MDRKGEEVKRKSEAYKGQSDDGLEASRHLCWCRVCWGGFRLGIGTWVEVEENTGKRWCEMIV